MTAPREDGFEYNGEFHRWSVSDGAKDLMLIDHFTHMPVHEFFETVEDSFDRGRAPILLALIATSMRAKHPDRSTERIIRTVEGLALSEVEFIDADEQEDPDQLPPAPGGQQEPPTENSDSPAAESRSSATAPEPSTSATSAVTPG